MSNTTNLSLVSLRLLIIQKEMTLYVLPLMLIIGCIGNVLNSCVFLRRNFCGNSSSIYLISSSISHTILLILAMSTSLYSFVNLDPLTYSLIYCKIRPYFISCLFMISRTYIVLACVDRYALCSPHANIRSFSRLLIAYRLIPIVIIIWIVLPIHISIFNTIVSNRCIMPEIYSLLYSVYAVICAGIYPPSLMIIFSLLAYRNVRIMRQRIVPNGTSVGCPRTRLRKVDYQIMKMLFVEVTIYILSTFAFPMNTVYISVTKSNPKSDDQIVFDGFLTFLSASILQYINASTAMYSNLATSGAFRSELKKMFVDMIKFNRGLKDEYSKKPTGDVTLNRNALTMNKEKMTRSILNQHNQQTEHINQT